MEFLFSYDSYSSRNSSVGVVTKVTKRRLNNRCSKSIISQAFSTVLKRSGHKLITHAHLLPKVRIHKRNSTTIRLQGVLLKWVGRQHFPFQEYCVHGKIIDKNTGEELQPNWRKFVCHRHEGQMTYQQKFKFLRRSLFFVLFIDIKMQQQTVVAKTE
jgi:hypothetical protein